MEVKINVDQFYERLDKLIGYWMSNKSIFGGVDTISIPLGATQSEDSAIYSKSTSTHQYLFGYEFPDSIILLTKNSFYFMATAKKCSYLESAFEGNSSTPSGITLNFLKKSKDDAANREMFHTLIGVARKNNGKKVGSLYKSDYNGTFIPSWIKFIGDELLEKVEIASAMGSYFCRKDAVELVTNYIYIYILLYFIIFILLIGFL
jgi:nucleosome binding factor SPN SPT16 subunit